MKRQRIEHHATAVADTATVYALLRDGAGWPSWSPIESFELERPGAGEPEGIGAARLFRVGRVVGHDEIVELVPDRRFSYTNTSNVPYRDYRGDVDLEPVAEGTAIRWMSQFDPKLPGTGWLLRRGLDGFIAKLTEGLAARATAVAAERTVAA
jgi:polyketide cyclase/dehydrase/lipid transport protein